MRVEVEVANFYPALASAVARWLYSATQSRIHVIVTHGFLRSLARLDLAESVVGRYAAPDDIDAVPDPPARASARSGRAWRRPARPAAADGRAGAPSVVARPRYGAAGCVWRPVTCMSSSRRGTNISAAKPTRT